MPLTNVFAAALLALLLTQPLQAEGPAQPVEILTPNHIEYPHILSALQLSVERLLGISIHIDVRELRLQGDFAFIGAIVANPDGSDIDFSKTLIAEFARQDFDGPKLWAYMLRDNGSWMVLEQDIGPTDAWFVFWPSEHGGSCEIIAKGMTC